MTRFPFTLLACGFLACSPRADHKASRSASPNATDTTALVVVDRPTVIGFFPPARDSVEASQEGYSEGVAHVGFALQDAEACLGRDSARVILVVDTAVRILRGPRTDTLRFPGIDSLSYGAYLIAPASAPQLLNAPIGPSALIPAVLEALPSYFDRPPCAAK